MLSVSLIREGLFGKHLLFLIRVYLDFEGLFGSLRVYLDFAIFWGFIRHNGLNGFTSLTVQMVCVQLRSHETAARPVYEAN